MVHDEVRHSHLRMVEAAVESVLENQQIHDIGSYGWGGPDEPDLDLIGHAMWQTDLSLPDLDALFGFSPVSRRPTEVEKLILTLGEDLCGLMRASRLSIGLALVWAPHAKLTALNVPNDPPYFWVHHMNAFLTLAIASDRLRDLLIVASTGAGTETFEKRGTSNKERREDRWYVTPFNEAGQLLSSRGLKTEGLNQAITDLPTEAAALYAYVHRRDVIVHKTATRTAEFAHQTLRDLQAKFDEQKENGFQPRTDGPEEWFPSAEAREAELCAEIDSVSKELRDWYLLLIKASSNVFQVEYRSRALR